MSIAEKCYQCGTLEVRYKMHHSQRDGHYRSYCEKCWEKLGWKRGRPGKPVEERTCWKCGGRFQANEVVVRKVGDGKTRQICKECWDARENKNRRHAVRYGRWCKICDADMAPLEWKTVMIDGKESYICLRCWEERKKEKRA